MTHEIDCPKCCGVGKITVNSKRCKMGVHNFHYIKNLPSDHETKMIFIRKCYRCGKSQRCQVNLSTDGGVYHHYYWLREEEE